MSTYPPRHYAFERELIASLDNEMAQLGAGAPMKSWFPLTVEPERFSENPLTRRALMGILVI
jgi:hypothetical protein